ncbi:MAG TPA: serine O-acetyltransferase [Rhodobiaceae bacterium]|nr:serine O-acetyltransferase [Rhodobiaceae bacterium]
MAETEKKLATVDPVWSQIREDAAKMAENEPTLSGFLHATILNFERLEMAIASHLSEKLANSEIGARSLCEVFEEAFSDNKEVSETIRADIVAHFDRDPACRSYLDPVLYFKGFLALQTYRAANWLINAGRRGMALYLQNRASEVFQADIHPAANIGKGVFIDHATGVVIGETAVVGDDVSMLHGVTLGGSGKDGGDRHPKIGDGVLISVGAKVLGNIRVGDCAKIGGGSVVLTDVPAYTTAVGVPAKIVGKVTSPEPSRQMDHSVGQDGDAI